MKTIEVTTADKPLAEYTQDLDIIVLTSHQEPFAAIVSLRNQDKETLALSINPEFIEIIEAARLEFAAGKRLTLAEMKRALERIPS